jgi:PAS domain S-box-containing protein
LAGLLPASQMQFRLGGDQRLDIEAVSDGLWDRLGGRPSDGGSPSAAFWRAVDARDRDALRQSLESSPQTPEWSAQWRMTDATGQPRWLHGVGRPWRLADGSLRCRALVIDLAGTPASRLLSERRFRDLINAIPNVAVQGYDHELVCRFWNAASEQLYGYTAEEAIGRSLLDLIIPAAMREEVVRATRSMLDSGEAIPSAELVLQDKQGHPVHVHSGHVLLRRPGEAPEFFCIDFDLGERRQAEAAHRQLETQLREVQKMEALGTLAGGVAHDFNNILAAILGNVTLALEDTDEASPARTSLLEIQKAGRRARAITQQILTFARHHEEQRERLDLGPLVQELQGIFRTGLPPSTRLAIEVAPDLPPVLANATQIQQVLLNLVTNAVQAAAACPGAQVTVRVWPQDGPPLPNDGAWEVLRSAASGPRPGVRLEVVDNGSGMTAETAQRIFEPFFTTKPSQKGTGLGLSVVHGILRDHDATLHLHTTPGQGSRFSLWFAASADVALPSP